MMHQPPTQLWGIDFTSAPSRQKPIVAVNGEYLPKLQQINITQIYKWTTFAEFKAFLATQPTQLVMAAVDIPLGMPKTLLEQLNWADDDWAGSIHHIASLSKSDYRAKLKHYQAQQPKGAKEPRRPCDFIAGALSPAKLHYIPTANMLYEGATRIATQAHISVWPCRYQPEAAFQLVEGYPALVMKTLAATSTRITATGYKHEQPLPNDGQAIRQHLLALMASTAATRQYGAQLNISEEHHQLAIDDYKGDVLDGLACLLQACWAANYLYSEKAITKVSINPVEGWIVDPKTMA